VQDADAARASLTEAGAAFASADERLDAPWVVPASWLPGARRQVLAARALADAGSLAVRAGVGAVQALEARPAGGFRVRNGRIDLDSLAAAADGLRSGLPFAERAVLAVEDAPVGWLLPPLANVRADAERRIVRGRDVLARGLAGLDAAPTLLGADGRKRYLIAASNLSELRGTGGFFNFFALVDATDGKLDLLDTGRATAEFPHPGRTDVDVPDWYRRAYARYAATELLQNVNMTTDFPTVGSILAQITPDRVDGVIQIDPDGIAALLQLTGPVRVEGWPDAITPDNVSEITQHEVYKRFDQDKPERDEFIEALIRTVFGRLLSSNISMGEPSLEILGAAVNGGHIQTYVTEPDAQESLSAAGLARGVERAYDATDVFSLVNENGSGSKIDWFLRRDVRITVAPDTGDGTATMRASISMRNQAPAAGLPGYIIGGSHVDAGVNRSIVIMLRPPFDELGEIVVDGRPQSVSRDQEAALRSYHGEVTIEPEGSVSMQATFTAPDALIGTGRHRTYRLHILQQPVAFPDAYSVTIEVPDGWRARGAATFDGKLTSDVVLEVELDQTLPAWLFETAVQRPFRLAKRLVTDLF